MELKYYLRGLGLGIAITAVIMGFTTSKSKAMTNEEIIARAKQLGMTEDTVLSEIHSEKEDSEAQIQDTDVSEQERDVSEKTDEKVEDVDGASVQSESPEDDNDVLADAAGDEAAEDIVDVSGENVKTDDSGDAAGTSDLGEGTRMTDTGADVEAGDTDTEVSVKPQTVSNAPMVITIGRGDGSYSVSKKLADVGAVESAGDFDTFLCQNGYDKRIRTGTYTIAADASDEQIARIITGLE